MIKIPTLQVAGTAKKGPKSDSDLVLAFQSGSSKKSGGPKGGYSAVLEKLKKSDSFTAKLGSQQFVRFGGRGGADDVLFVGLGKADELTEEKIRQAGGHAYTKLKAEKARNIAINLEGITSAKLARALAEGLVLGAYQFEKHKSKESKKETYTGPARFTFVTRDKALEKAVKAELDQVKSIGEAVNVTRDWSNEPSNFGTPEYYAAEAKRLAHEYGLKCTILTEADAAKEKMGLFLGVGQGAEREGRIVVLEYNPKNAPHAKTIVFVGKGVTFDSGGISIKPSMRMEEMKHDMTGAATLMGAALLAAAWKVPNHVVTILAFTENMPDGNAIQPGNVLTSRNGKTVEIINTDAEGRLILADVLDYAHGFKPDAIIDAATLTGAVTIALGKQCCAILGNDEALIDHLRQIGDVNGERIWELPLFDEYFEDMKSETADMKNSVNDSYGGTIRGAIFLKQFIKKGTRWAHLDIAATAYNLTHLSYYPKRGASGSYVRTLAHFAQDFSG